MAEVRPQLIIQDLVLASQETGRVLLDRVTVTVNHTERVGLIGASGAGKTLLARSLVGMLPPGVIRKAGNIGRASDRALDLSDQGERRLASVVPQNPANALPLSTTALRLVRDVLSWTTTAITQDKWEGASQLLRAVGLGAEMHRKRPYQLSGGMAMRVAIGAALATNPWFLVLDEPSSGLDPVIRKHLAALLLTINRDRGTSLVIATHDLWMVAQLCDRVLVLEDGHIVAEGSPNVLAQVNRDSYVGKLFTSLRIEPECSSAQPLPKPEESPALEANGVVVDYVIGTPRRKRVRALMDVSFILARGGSTGIIGPSGAGKSTLALVSAGLLDPTRGTIRVFGAPAHARWWQRHVQRNHRIRMVFQNPFGAINPRRTIGAWLASVLRRAACGDQYPRAPGITVAQSLELVGLPERVQHARAAELSGGECQRVVIAACIASQAEILVLDEPVSMLDSIARDGIITLLQRLRRSQRWTYLIVSHDLPTVRRLCDTLLVLDAGHVVEAGPLEQVMQKPQHSMTKQLLEAYAGDTSADWSASQRSCTTTKQRS